MDIVVLSIIYFVLILAVVGVLIYLIVDFNKYKESDATNLQKALSHVDAESNERKSNVNYVIQEANKMNKGMYDELKGNIQDTKSDLQFSLDRFGRAIKLVNPSGSVANPTVGTNTSTGASSGSVGSDMPSNVVPDVNLMSKVTAMNGMTVKDIAKVDKLNLGDKWQFSGVGDAHANDDWLRMFNKDGTGYSGGIAMGKLWVGGPSYHNADANFRGGSSEHNPGYGTHLPYVDNKNYIRGDTEIRGNTNNIGDLNIGRHANVQGRLHFSDPSMSMAPNGQNNSDPTYIEKKVFSPNNSELRITINDDANESVSIRSFACQTGNCSGEGVQKHKFDGSGNATHAGWTTTNGLTTNGMYMPNGNTIWTDGRMHMTGGELLYLLNKNGVIVGKEWGGNGQLQVQGTLSANEGINVNGDVNATRLCTGNVCLRGEGSDVYMESKDKTKTIARFSPNWDKILLFTNSDGKAPYFYVNNGKGYGIWG